MIKEIRQWWCHKVLPLAYNEALSYYEAISKIIYKVNEIIANINGINTNAVFSVNSIKPISGNVDVGTVKSVNNNKPDANGNVSISVVSGVTSVDGVLPNDSGNVELNAVKTVNSKTPDSTGNVDVGTVKSVNNNKPDSNGNVSISVVGGVTSVDGVLPNDSGNVELNAVKTVNNKTPDSNGNVEVGTVKSINTNNTPDENGNIDLNATSVGAIPNTDGSIQTSNLGDGIVTIPKVNNDIIYLPRQNKDLSTTSYITKMWGHYLTWAYGTNKELTLNREEYDILDTFWETTILNQSGGALTIHFVGLPNVIDVVKGESHSGTYDYALANHTAIKIKKIANQGILIMSA